MKNKDGIVIKAGQVWKSKEDTIRRVLVLDRGEVITRLDEMSSLGAIGPEYEGFHTIIKSHGVDLERARKDGWLIWVEGMKVPDPEKIENVHSLSNHKKWHKFANSGIPSWIGATLYRYKLKPKQPEQPERLELAILRGVDKYECTSLEGKTVGVNEIRQAICVWSKDFDLIGYRYAESDMISCLGPNAWWHKNYSEVDLRSSRLDSHPVFATHVIYQKGKA